MGGVCVVAGCASSSVESKEVFSAASPSPSLVQPASVARRQCC